MELTDCHCSTTYRTLRCCFGKILAMPCNTAKRIVSFYRGIRASVDIALAMKRVGVPDHAMRSIPGYLVAASMP
jgi:hypothetical protein